MHPTSRFRPFLYFCLVALVHLAIIATFNIRHRRPHHLDKVESTVWIIPEVKRIKIDPSTKPTIFRSATRSHPTTRTVTAPTESQPRPEPVTAPVETETHLDLDALRADAVQQEITRKKSPIELANEAAIKNHSFEARVEEGVNRAQRADCRTAYSGAGLFAPLLVAADLVRDKGCKF